MLQGHAFRVEECWGHLLENGHQDIWASDGEYRGRLHRRYDGQKQGRMGPSEGLRRGVQDLIKAQAGTDS